jgi:release factor glutamine methyltransferase
LGKHRPSKKTLEKFLFLLKSKYPKYYSYQGRKISKRISLPKKKLIKEFYNDFSVDQDVIRYLNSKKIKNKINIPTCYRRTNIEIGFGNGEFLVKNAITRPNELFIGVEVYLNGIAKVLASILDFDLKNIILSNLNIFYFLQAMPHKSVDKIFLINPDPWLKKRHHKRRLMSHEIMSLLNKIIKSKNSIYMTTDSSVYLRDTVNLLSEYKESFGTFSSSILKKNDALYGISKYQRKAIENGGKIYLLTF